MDTIRFGIRHYAPAQLFAALPFALCLFSPIRSNYCGQSFGDALPPDMPAASPTIPVMLCVASNDTLRYTTHHFVLQYRCPGRLLIPNLRGPLVHVVGGLRILVEPLRPARLRPPPRTLGNRIGQPLLHSTMSPTSRLGPPSHLPENYVYAIYCSRTNVSTTTERAPAE